MDKQFIIDWLLERGFYETAKGYAKTSEDGDFRVDFVFKEKGYRVSVSLFCKDQEYKCGDYFNYKDIPTLTNLKGYIDLCIKEVTNKWFNYASF